MRKFGPAAPQRDGPICVLRGGFEQEAPDIAQSIRHLEEIIDLQKKQGG